MNNRKHADKGQPYVRLYNAMLFDDDLLDSGDLGYLLAVKALQHSAHQGTSGFLSSSPMRIQRWAQFEGGVEAVAAALDRLLEARFLVTTDDDASLLIRNWGRYQTDLGGSSTRAETAQRKALERHHREGRHADSKLGRRDGCSLCNQVTQPTAPEATAMRSKVVSVPVALAEDQGDAATRSMAAALEDFRDAIPATLAEFPTPFEGYTCLLQAADAFADLLMDLSDNPRGTLRSEVLAHSLRNLVDPNMSSAGVGRANKAAEALGTDGHRYWVHASVLAAGVPFDDEKHCLNWMTKTARNERSKAVTA